MPAVPPDFVSEAEKAFAHQDRAHLLLQSFEVSGLLFETPGRALIDRLLNALPPTETADRLVLFTGHRIDSPERAIARFPASVEPLAHQAIRRVLIHQQQRGQLLAISGGANGGDIIFLETCRELGIRFQMLLFLPQSQFIQESVAAPGDWVDRFQLLLNNAHPRILSELKELPSWLAAKREYTIWDRENLWMIASALAMSPAHFVLAALWDGQVGDGPGGTSNMVRLAQQYGAELIHIDTRQLLTHTDAIRTAEL